MRKKYEVQGMTCPGCVSRATALAMNAGAFQSQVSLQQGTHIIEPGTNFREDDYIRSMKLSGYSVREIEPSDTDLTMELSQVEQPTQMKLKK